MSKISKTFALILTVTIVMSCLTLLTVKPANAQSPSSIVINSDWSITGTVSIQQVGSVYILTSNISGDVQVKKSGITIDGSGYTLDGGIDLTNGIGPNLPSPSRPEITNVTIKNLHVSGGVGTNGGGNNTFYNDVFSNGNRDQGGFSIQLLGCSYNNISFCSFDNESQIAMDYSAAFNTVTNCNLPPYGILVWLSGYETVDNNYWSDYLTKYTNATEVDHSGVGNQPYVYYYSDENIAPNGTRIPIIYQDNHPLMKPVTIPLIGLTPTPTPFLPPRNAPHLDPIAYLLPISIILAVVIVLSVLLFRKHKNR